MQLVKWKVTCIVFMYLRKMQKLLSLVSVLFPKISDYLPSKPSKLTPACVEKNLSNHIKNKTFQTLMVSET